MLFVLEGDWVVGCALLVCRRNDEPFKRIRALRSNESSVFDASPISGRWTMANELCELTPVSLGGSCRIGKEVTPPPLEPMLA